MTVRLLAILTILCLAMAACGEDEPGAQPTATPGDTTEPGTDATATGQETDGGEATATETATEAAGGATATETDGESGFAPATVEVGDTELGEVLVDSAGLTLYLFDNDSDGESTCYDQCAQNWPPLLGTGAEAGDGVDESLLGVTERTDGAQQITYAGHPLYYFAGDSDPGDVNGQALQDIWWVVSPEGEAVHEAGEVSSNPYDY